MKGQKSCMKGLYLGVAVTVYACWLMVQPEAAATTESKVCYARKSPCFLKKQTCPRQCPSFTPSGGRSKVCVVDCYNPICQPTCRNRKPNCNGKGSACLDPRFIGGDGIVFYFHGKRDEHFSLVSDSNLHINARFIGLRPSGRTRDFTWIQALGILFGAKNQSFTLHATKTAKWDHNVDHLRLSYNGNDVVLPERDLSVWKSPEDDIRVERTSDKNSVLISLSDMVEIWVNVVPVTKEDDRIHNYRIPEDDCFAHMEVQFKFMGLSPRVEGVLGRTYRVDFENPAKPGVAMPVVGGEDKYKTASLLEADCKRCVFGSGQLAGDSPEKIETVVTSQGTVDCTGGGSSGVGIVCRK
ncbi:PREDICTED: uncharacterized protein LOC104816928 [Tarenaya hassleriana]|uniref:uncharacterized protein LOC104816928 n=1 Tax=Tarenaya hassleriana TaxID=28532 RepID=UPI00053C5E93|nr:PREDICTED: uncharacterized protein LOC104816928 [Tarenaya hassleriana]